MTSAHTLAQSDMAQLITNGIESFKTAIANLDILNRPDELIGQLQQLPLFYAAVIVVVGILCVLNGYRWHRWVVAVLALVCGFYIGRALSTQMESSTIVAASIGILCAIIATPMMRVAVALFGGVTGAFVGSNMWTAFEAGPAETHWAGALAGFILLAMASLVMFRLVIVLFTSIGGAAMAVFGGIALLLNVPSLQGSVTDALTTNRLMIPLLMAVAAVGGFVLQESKVREEEQMQHQMQG